MKLCTFEIRNFKGIEDAKFDWDSIVVLIGENNVGKSSVLQALEIFLSGSAIKDEVLFKDKLTDQDHCIELVGHFSDLSDAEKGATAVQSRMDGERWIIKKQFWLDEKEGKWNELYWSFSSKEQFKDWPDPDKSWTAFPSKYGEFVEEVKATHARVNAEARDMLRRIIRQRAPQLLDQTPADWVRNPGGGGNWKSNANSIMPLCIPVRAVHDASSESVSKEASAYGKLVGLIVEKKLLRRPEVIELQEKFNAVLTIFRPGEDQAPEIKELQERINARLNEVIGGFVSIETEEPDVKPLLLPSTTLELRDREEGVRTPIREQGHGLQRTLIISLLQLLAEVQAELQTDEEFPEVVSQGRAVVLAVEEPELYMHPQIERKMRDTLYRLASQENTQVICSTHSPVFIDLSGSHRAILRCKKDGDRRVTIDQPEGDLYDGLDEGSEKDRLNMITRFDPAINEVFFAKRVVVLEDKTAQWAFERAAELTGLFETNPGARRDTTVIVAASKKSFPSFLRVLNHFSIPYLVVPDFDEGNASAQAENGAIEALAKDQGLYYLRPTSLEGLLGYEPTNRDKPFQAVKKVEDLFSSPSGLPAAFLEALNMVYLGPNQE